MAKSSEDNSLPALRWTVMPKTSQEKYLIFFCTVWAALIVLGVQLSKIAVERFMEYGESIPLIPGFFHLTFVTNNGANQQQKPAMTSQHSPRSALVCNKG